jgi:hypothetical protein
VSVALLAGAFDGGGMANRDIVAIGTSAGGFEALRFLAKGFDQDFPASILVTIHLPLEFRSELDQLLSLLGICRLLSRLKARSERTGPSTLRHLADICW